MNPLSQNTTNKVFLGGKGISKVYLSDKLVWEDYRDPVVEWMYEFSVTTSTHPMVFEGTGENELYCTVVSMKQKWIDGIEDGYPEQVGFSVEYTDLDGKPKFNHTILDGDNGKIVNFSTEVNYPSPVSSRITITQEETGRSDSFNLSQLALTTNYPSVSSDGMGSIVARTKYPVHSEISLGFEAQSLDGGEYLFSDVIRIEKGKTEGVYTYKGTADIIFDYQGWLPAYDDVYVYGDP